MKKENGEYNKGEDGCSASKQIQSHILEQFGNGGKYKSSAKQVSNILLVTLQQIFISFNILHTILAQVIMEDPQNFQSILRYSEFFKYYRITYIAIIILKLILFLSLFLEILRPDKQILIASGISRKIIKAFILLKEVDFSLTAFLCLTNLKENIAGLVISAFINIVYTIYIQNYITRKEMGYSSSTFHSLTFRLFLISNYFLNLLLNFLENQAVFSSYYGCLSILCFIWYLRKGSQIYISQTLRQIFKVLVALFITFYLKSLQSVLLSNYSFSMQDIAKSFLIFILVIFSFNSFPVCMQMVSLKEFDLHVHKLLEQSFRDPNINVQLIGLLTYYSKQWQGEESIYDPFLKSSIQAKDFCLQKQSIVRNYLKKRYIRHIQACKHQNYQYYLEYCEYLCNYDLNYYQIQKYLQRLDQCPLNLMQRVKVRHIKASVKEANSSLNKLLYCSKMHLEAVLQSQSCFVEIEKNILQYIQQNTSIWQMMRLPQVSIAQFRNTLESSFRIRGEISKLWKNISPFINLNNKWISIYLHYRFSINNQKLKQKEIQALRLSNLQAKNIKFEPCTSSKDFFNSILLYDKECFCLRASFDLGQLIIKQVNERFEDITGYTRGTVLNSTVEILMNEQLKKNHQSKFNLWLERGLLSNEDQYQIQKAEIVTADNNILSAFKYFKCFYSIQSGVDFFCMIKINNVQARKKSIKSSQTISSMSDQKLSFHKIATNEKDKNSQNMFIKQDIFEPLKNAKEILYMKLASRIFLVIMIISAVVTSIITQDTNTNLISFSSQYINYMAVYRFPVILSTNYLKSILKVGNQTKVTQQIQAATTNFINSAKDPITKITLFDESLNPYNKYYPYYNYSFLANDSLTQIDLFYTIGSCISSLNKLPVNQTSQQYQRFTSYLKPSYDNMMNITKYKLHQKFSNIFKNIVFTQLLTICIDFLAFVIFVLLIVGLASRLIKRMSNVLLIIAELRKSQVDKSLTYWKSLYFHFNQLFQFKGNSTQIITAQTINKESSLKIEDAKVQTNSSSKRIKSDGIKAITFFKIKVIIIICVFMIFASSASAKIINIVKFNKLYEFEEVGFYFLRFFPVGPLVTMGCMEKYFFDANPQDFTFKYQKYDGDISAIFIFGSNDYFVDEDIDSIYYKKRQNYFFGNPCQYNPTALKSTGIDISKCESICNGTFKQGLSAFLRYAYHLGQDCIRNKVNLTSAQLDEFTLGGTVLSAFVLDSINTWLLQFIQRLSSNLQSNRIQAIVGIIIIIILHLCVIQVKVIPFLKKQYEFTKNVYRSMVSQALLIKQKIIKQKFIIQGLIST